jgi:hypothetical protein
MTLMEHVAQMGEKRIAFQIFMGKPEGRIHLEDLCFEGRVLLK